MDLFSGKAHLIMLDAQGHILACSQKFDANHPGSLVMEAERTGTGTRLIVKGPGWSMDISDQLRAPMAFTTADTLTVGGLKIEANYV